MIAFWSIARSFALQHGVTVLAFMTLGIDLASWTSPIAAAVSFGAATESKSDLAAVHAIQSSTSTDTSSGANTHQKAANGRHILHFSDVHLNLSTSHNDSESADIPVAYGKDAPLSLLVSALVYAKKVLPDPDLFLYTGDHVVRGKLTDEYLAEVVEQNVKTMAEYYAITDSDKMMDVTAIVGNADTNPGYSMEVTDPATEENPDIALISGAWQDSLTEVNFDWLKRRGYLAYNLDDKLTVLTLNTLPYSPDHKPDTSSVMDPFEQFAWLNASLAGLQRAGKFAYIVGHIPPVVDSFSGSPLWNETYIKTYKSIVRQYSKIIKAQLFGHVHSIEFRLPLSRGLDGLFQRDGVLLAEEEQDSSELVPLFMAAAISPIFASNPAFMVWDYDNTTYDLLDFTVHGGNISSASGTVDWQPLFKASEEYNVSTLKASDIVSFVESAAADAKLLEQYYYDSKAQSHRQPSCLDVSCQAKWLCSLYWWSRVRDYEACVTSTVVSKSKGTTTFTVQQSTPSPSGSLLYVSTVIILAGLAVTIAFVLVTSSVCRRGDDQESSKLLYGPRVNVAAIA